jgi:hypothetical protein
MQNTLLDDIANVVGYTPARKIALAYAGRRLCVPRHARDETHAIAYLIGMPAYRALVREFPGEELFIPGLGDDDRFRRDLIVAARLADGQTYASVAADLGITPRRVEQIAAELEDRGWLKFSSGLGHFIRLLRLHRRGHGRGPAPTLKTVDFLGMGEVSDETPLPAAGA